MVVAHVVSIAVAIGVCPLGAIGWEGIDDAVTLIGCVVAVVVLINVSIPVVDALVIATVSGHDVDAVWAPCNIVHDTTWIAVTGACATVGPWAAECVDLYT